VTAFLVLVVSAVGGLLYASWYGSEPVRIRRMLRNAQTYAIVDLGDGQTGRIVGKAQLHRDHLVAPLSGRRCLYYVATIEQSKYGTDIWTPLATEQSCVPFAVTDASGRAIVDATHAHVALEFDHQSESRTVEELDDAQRTLLARQRIDPLHRLLRYAEAIVTDGKRVSVLGAGTREPDPDAPPESAYRGAQPTRLRLTGSRRHPLVMSDAP
jgi:hypothetical protein